MWALPTGLLFVCYLTLIYNISVSELLDGGGAVGTPKAGVSLVVE